MVRLVSACCGETSVLMAHSSRRLRRSWPRRPPSQGVVITKKGAAPRPPPDCRTSLEIALHREGPGARQSRRIAGGAGRRRIVVGREIEQLVGDVLHFSR